MTWIMAGQTCKNGAAGGPWSRRSNSERLVTPGGLELRFGSGVGQELGHDRAGLMDFGLGETRKARKA